jgi:hypothetical protein
MTLRLLCSNAKSGHGRTGTSGPKPAATGAGRDAEGGTSGTKSASSAGLREEVFPLVHLAISPAARQKPGRRQARVGNPRISGVVVSSVIEAVPSHDA